jgi:hypothetical protein
MSAWKLGNIIRYIFCFGGGETISVYVYLGFEIKSFLGGLL